MSNLAVHLSRRQAVHTQTASLGIEFFAANAPTPEFSEALMRLARANPFCTRAYAEAKRSCGYQPWLLGLTHAGTLIAGCYGFVRSGRLNRTLEIRSLPDLPWNAIFWNGLLRFCVQHRITNLALDNRDAPAVRIPVLRGEVERRHETDYVLDLTDPCWERKVMHCTKRGIGYDIMKARKAGLSWRRVATADACRQHARVVLASLSRRRKRGESVADAYSLKSVTRVALQATETGAGELFQAVAGGEVFSSCLVLLAPEGAILESHGTSSEGMRCGASPFLLYSIVPALRGESLQTWNLGTGQPGTGLSLFKTRLGALPVPMEHVTVYLGSDVRRAISTAARILLQRGKALSA